MKRADVPKEQLRKRLGRSFLIGGGLLILFIAGFCYVQFGSEENGTSVVLRSSFRMNEELWKSIRSSTRPSVEKPKPPKGKDPRFNGNLGLKSTVDLKNYKIKVDSGKEHLTLTVSTFHLLPKVGYATDFRCIEGWSEEIHYAGAKFEDFLNFYNLGKKPDGSYYAYVGFETPDQAYYVSLDMESMLHPQTVLAYEMNEVPLTLKHGAPLRLIIPIKYGIKSIKRIGRIFFSDQRPPDYWAERGYDWYSGL